MAQPQVVQQQIQQQVVVVQQGGQMKQGYPQNVRDWSTGLCGCFEDFGSCIYAYFFYPCFMCTVANHLDESIFVPICLQAAGNVALRTKTRTMFGINGGICKDFLTVAYCDFCSSTQMMRELKAMGH